MKNEKYLPVFALYEEAEELSRKLEKMKKVSEKTRLPLITGLGKINAATKLANEIGSLNGDELGFFEFDTVVNLGTAGSADFKSGTIVQCMSFYQRDMQVPGYIKGFTPFEELKATDYIIRHKVSKKTKDVAMCNTGDSFVMDISETNKGKDKLLFDMEAYALAKVCTTYRKKFECYKFITDDGDFKDWEKTLKKASKALSKFYVENFIK